MKETERLYGVLDERLERRDFIAVDYSIADMACYPWIVPHERHGQNLDEFRNLQRWFRAIEQRPAVQRAYQIAKEINTKPTVNEDSKSVLFGQGRRPAR